MVCMALSLAACSKPGTPIGTEADGTENVSQESITPELETDDVVGEMTEYKVILVDADGDSVAGQMVQVCNDSTYFPPAVTNNEGVAVFTLAESNKYKAKLMTAPDDAYVPFGAGKKEITLKLPE